MRKWNAGRSAARGNRGAKGEVEPSPRARKGEAQKLFSLPVSGELPPLSLMDETDPADHHALSEDALKRMADRLELKLQFGVEAAVVGSIPAVITRFEIEPAAGVKVSRISGLARIWLGPSRWSAYGWSR